ncbi:MAG TPA: prephenate dehydrogenase/arogenate dehydrogenase family protein [Burkholderiales bacterium]|nr:prephenate dehydrogenase/arogenate dehydrogenase family protein [Burkholderiales bacterium]
MSAISKLTVIGVGLIGGSFALALKAAGAVQHVVGVGRSAENLQLALSRGVIDAIETDVAQAVQGAQLVFVATPVGSMHAVFQSIAPHLSAEALITDGGSTKQSVIAAARAALGKRVGRFIPSHPIAGSDRSGAQAASSELYRGREVILCPLEENRSADVVLVRTLWQQCGARVSEMAADQHDAVLSAISHLPHFISYAYVNAIAAHQEAPELLRHAGGGFRDFTRLAGSHPQMWADICLANRDALLAELSRFDRANAALRALLEAGDVAGLEKHFAAARSLRERWAKSSGQEISEGE